MYNAQGTYSDNMILQVKELEYDDTYIIDDGMFDVFDTDSVKVGTTLGGIAYYVRYGVNITIRAVSLDPLCLPCQSMFENAVFIDKKNRTIRNIYDKKNSYYAVCVVRM